MQNNKVKFLSQSRYEDTLFDLSLLELNLRKIPELIEICSVKICLLMKITILCILVSALDSIPLNYGVGKFRVGASKPGRDSFRGLVQDVRIYDGKLDSL